MPPENPDRTDAAEERVVAVLQGIAQLWLKLLEFQQGPEQHVRIEQQLHALQLLAGQGLEKRFIHAALQEHQLAAAFPQASGPGRSYGDPALEAI